jgi:NAD(P)H dehydrogenase (quinone)
VSAVLGASGRIGRHVAAALAEHRVDARALVRDPTRRDLSLPAVHADLAEAATLRQALHGVTRLLLVTPHSPDQDLLEAAAIDAAARAGVQRVVKVSGGAASLGPNGTTATATAHWRSEQHLERSGMGFTFLRPSFFQQNLLAIGARRGVLAAPFRHAPIAMVDVRDVAACAVAALTDPSPADQAWQPTGPRAVSFDDIADCLGVRYLPIPPKLAGRVLAPSARHGPRSSTPSGWRRTSPPGATALRPTTSCASPVVHPARSRHLLDEHRDRFITTKAP